MNEANNSTNVWTLFSLGEYFRSLDLTWKANLSLLLNVRIEVLGLSLSILSL